MEREEGRERKKRILGGESRWRYTRTLTERRSRNLCLYPPHRSRPETPNLHPKIPIVKRSRDLHPIYPRPQLPILLLHRRNPSTPPPPLFPLPRATPSPNSPPFPHPPYEPANHPSPPRSPASRSYSTHPAPWDYWKRRSDGSGGRWG